MQSYSIDIHAGIAAYANEADWHLQVVMRAYPEDLEKWDGDGVIVRSFESGGRGEAAGEFPRIDLPKVVIGRHVAADDARVGALAADYLLRQGYSSIACYAGSARSDSDCLAEFRNIVARHGEGIEASSIDMPAKARGWLERKKAIQAALKGRQQPAGVFALNDELGSELLEAAMDAGFLVPEDVAILGAGNDILICENLPVPLSSIDPDFKRLGYEAARMLDRHLDGRDLPPKPFLIPPRRVIVRRSTDIMAIREQHVSRALGFIQRNLHRRFTVDQVAQVAGFSKRALYKAFQKQTGMAIGAYIEKMRLHAAESLLTESNLSVGDIARHAGFGEPRNLYHAFKRHHGKSPREWRSARKR